MKMKTLALVIIATSLCMTSCSGTNKSTADTYMATGAELPGNGEVEKTLNLGSFSGIEASVIVDIHYTQDTKRSVKVRATQKQIDRCDISVSGSTLVLKTKKNVPDSDDNSKQDKITLYITAPEISVIENRGIMGFYTKQLNGDGLQIKNKGILNMNVQNVSGKGGSGLSIDNTGRMTAEMTTVDMNIFSLENMGVLMFQSNSIKGGSLTINNSGQLNIKGNMEGSTANLYNKGVCNMSSAFNLTGSYSCSNGGQLRISGDVKGSTATLKNTGMYGMEGSFHLDNNYTYANSGQADNNGDVTANAISITNSGVDRRNGKLKSEQLDMNVNGQSRYEMSFSGGEAKLYCSGIGNFEMALDCRSIKVNSSGQINVTLSGTADNTSFDGSGISHVNTSRLNKF